MTYSVTPIGSRASIPRISILPITFMRIPDSKMSKTRDAVGVPRHYYYAGCHAPRTLSFIGAHQFRLRQHMALHGLFQLGLGRLLEVRQGGVERIEFVKIPMPA